MHRISVRAVYNLGESEDSNTLLVASVNHPQVENEQTVSTLGSSSEKEVIPLPRSSQPPAPAAQPFLVSKTSTLSKSESFSGLETVSVSNSETCSVSMNQLSVQVDRKPDRVASPVSQGVANVERTLPSQTVEPVSPAQFDKESPGLHKQQSTATKHDLGVYPIDHSLVSTTTPRGETKHEPYTTNPQFFSHSSTTTPTSQTCTATSFRDSSKEGQTGSDTLPGLGTSAGLVFTGCEARLLELAQKEVCSAETYSTPLLTSPTSPNEAGAVHGIATAVSGERTHPCFMATVGDDVHNKKTKSANTNLKVVLPLDRRSSRLAANFDAYNTQTDSHSIAFTSPSHPMKKNIHAGDCAITTLSPTPLTSTQHSTQGSDVSLTPTHHFYKEGSIVGQTNSPGLSGLLSQQIDFSEEGQRRDGLACENRAELHDDSQVQSPRMPLGMFGCDSKQSTVNRPHLSTCHHQSPIHEAQIKDNPPMSYPPLLIADTRDREHVANPVTSLSANCTKSASVPTIPECL